MTQYIKVAEAEDEEAIEIPCETDDTILLTTLTSSFPGASGLKYRNAESGSMRGLRLIDGKLQAPDEGWPSISVYYCSFPKEGKRKIEDQSDNVGTKTKRVEEKKCSDLIVLGLAWKTTDKELREYFEQMGELLIAQVKKDPRTGMSKGFGFIRFSDYDTQIQAVKKRHYIDGRWCDVRIPMPKENFPTTDFRNPNQEFNRKIFIGRITADITTEDLKEYFSKYGDIADIFIPKPFRGFAFVTFSELNVTETLYGDDHIIKNVSIHVSSAVPKVEMARNFEEPYRQPTPYTSTSKPYGRYSSYPNLHSQSLPQPHPHQHSNPNHMATPVSPSQHQNNYSPPVAQYDSFYGANYSRPRPSPSQHSSYPESSNSLYNRSNYSTYASSDYSSYYH